MKSSSILRLSRDFEEELVRRQKIYQELLYNMGKRVRVSRVDASMLIARELRVNEKKIKKSGIFGL